MNLKSELTINGVKILKNADGKKKWTLDTLGAEIKTKLLGASVQTIEIEELEADSEATETFIDFLQSLISGNNRLKKFSIKNIHGQDERLDNSLLRSVTKKTDSFEIGQMPSMSKDVKLSFTKAAASSLQGSVHLKEIDFQEFVSD